MSRMSNNVQHLEVLNKMKIYVLKAHINCQGCVEKVRKLLHKIPGVYSVNIDAEEEKITVLGSVDCATLIKRLGKAGKHAHQILSTPSLPRDHNIQTQQLVENGKESHEDHIHHQYGGFEDFASSIRAGGVAALMPQYYEDGQYSPLADYQFNLQSYSNGHQL